MTAKSSLHFVTGIKKKRYYAAGVCFMTTAGVAFYYNGEIVDAWRAAGTEINHAADELKSNCYGSVVLPYGGVLKIGVWRLRE